MPIATFARIRDVSSEDKHQRAENLIKPQPGKTWKTCNVGEKLAYVILEMDEAKKITGIDIGNEHSAFVEVLVGNSTSLPSDFKEILITCSFMTPIESRSSNNANRVRCFNEAALVPSTAEKKWSLVKIVCTQPFNKHVQYGLSFLKVHVALNPSAINKQNKLPICSEYDNCNLLKIGKFKLRENSPDSENEGASNLFNRWKISRDEKGEQTTSLRLASNVSLAQVKSKDESGVQTTSLRLASNVSIAQAKHPAPTINPKTDRPENFEILDRNRDDIMFGVKEQGIDAEKGLRFGKKIEIDKQRRLSELQRKSKEIRSPKNSEEIRSIEVKEDNKNTEHVKQKATLTHTSEDISLECVRKRHSSPPAERPPKKEKKISHVQYKPFNKLLEGVVLVISGIQNPDRCDLRNKALSLGAKYKGDWDNSCTHLICAFKSTPKYNQVKSKGKIITRTWIDKCYSSKKYLPWRRYALDSQELAKPESDEEILDESLKPQKSLENKKRRGETQQKPLESNAENFIKNGRKELCPNSTDVFQLPTDEEDYLHDKIMQIDTMKKIEL